MLVRIREGLRVTFLDPMQRAVTIPRAILDFLDAFSLSVIVIYVIREVGLSPGLMGLAFALSSVGFVIGSIVAPAFERRFGVDGAIMWGLALIGASPYTMVAASDALPDWVNVSFFALPGLIGGFGGVIQHAGLQAIRQSITPEHLLGRVYASASFLGRASAGGRRRRRGLRDPVPLRGVLPAQERSGSDTIPYSGTGRRVSRIASPAASAVTVRSPPGLNARTSPGSNGNRTSRMSSSSRGAPSAASS
jgi:hypothetical protein